ncbi:MAG: hypothetical protein R3E68_04290 [Burkholderiaceae bacterium]
MHRLQVGPAWNTDPLGDTVTAAATARSDAELTMGAAFLSFCSVTGVCIDAPVVWTQRLDTGS